MVRLGTKQLPTGPKIDYISWAVTERTMGLICWVETMTTLVVDMEAWDTKQTWKTWLTVVNFRFYQDYLSQKVYSFKSNILLLTNLSEVCQGKAKLYFIII